MRSPRDPRNFSDDEPDDRLSRFLDEDLTTSELALVVLIGCAAVIVVGAFALVIARLVAKLI